MKKKLFTFILSLLCIVAFAFSFTACDPNSGDNGGDKIDASGGEDENGDSKNDKPMQGLIFILNDGGETYTVKGTTHLFDVEAIVIPETYEGKPVTVIGDSGFARCANAKTITLPNSITVIENCAFADCTELISINIPSNVTVIGTGAFMGCTKLKDVNLNEGLLEIRYDAFMNCSSLENIEIPDSVILIDYDVFKDCNIDFNIYGNGMYVGNTNNPYKFLISIFGSAETCILHENTVYICTSAIYDCRDLGKLTIHKSLKAINSWAFNLCQNPFLIEFDGTLEEWEKVDKADGWNGEKTIQVNCSNGNKTYNNSTSA